jgi:hypothetical protein
MTIHSRSILGIQDRIHNLQMEEVVAEEEVVEEVA